MPKYEDISPALSLLSVSNPPVSLCQLDANVAQPFPALPTLSAFFDDVEIVSTIPCPLDSLPSGFPSALPTLKLSPPFPRCLSPCIVCSLPSLSLSPNLPASLMVKKAMASSDFEEVKRAGNEQYKRGHFAEALCLHDQAIASSPDSAACRSNRAAMLMGLGRLGEAVRECKEAVKLDPRYGRAHQQLASLHLR